MTVITWSSREMGGICGSCETSEVNATESMFSTSRKGGVRAVNWEYSGRKNLKGE